MLRKSLIAALSIVLATGFTPSASANEHEATQGIYTQNSNANTSTDLPYFEFSNETENSVDAEVKNGTLAMTEDGSVNVLDNDGSVSYTLNVDGVTPNGTPAQYEYQIDGNQVSVNWTESASQQIMSVQANSATDQYGLPADPADKAACLASILGMGIATASFIIATGGTSLALAGAGISYLTSAAGTVLGCQV
ncbi:hypothetical protein HF851_06965 [Corynebacterium ammoniagenes]|uniref:hypothetical protein n=1 Tax=Corynebacterium ammoniagenes TaxID=1697 RepID=UPI001459A36C|nr:hypothetical protein [Corynebacterium ammoniagenes]NMF32017.1 hypothetical protein [Corynebacterium ammoniagenes]